MPAARFTASLSSKRLNSRRGIHYVALMKSLLQWLCCLALLVVAGCEKKPAASPTVAAAKSYTIAVIPKGTTHEFWKSINAGAFKARDELAAQGFKVDVIWKGPLKEDDRVQQIQTVDNFTSRRVSGLVLAPLDSQALVRPVASAVQ